MTTTDATSTLTLTHRTCQYGANYLLNMRFESTRTSDLKQKGSEDCSKCSEENNFFTFQSDGMSDGTCQEIPKIDRACEVSNYTSRKCQTAKRM